MADHFYTTDIRGETAPQKGYERQGIAAYVFPKQLPGTIPLYRCFHQRKCDHFYTTSLTEAKRAVSRYRYKDQGIACYVFEGEQPNNVPLYRLWRRRGSNHFYTTSKEERDEAIAKHRYKDEGIACYVLPQRYSGSMPFMRWSQTGLMLNFTFDSAISPENKARLLERHSYAHYRARLCDSLSKEHKEALLNAYKKPISHGIETRPNYNASANVGGNYIDINFNLLFPQGDDEIAQTLIHEMMHCAGADHPKRRPCSDDMTSGDCPGDGGPYFGSPPLLAEMCITGVQTERFCDGRDGVCGVVHQ